MNNNSTQSGASEEAFSMFLTVVIWLVTVIVAVVTVAGNILVLAAYHYDRSLQIPSNLFIVSLAISDLIIGLEGFPVLTMYLMNKEIWYLGDFLCRTWLTLDYTLCLVSILTVLLITIDRYCCVCKATKYRQWQTKTKVCVMIVFSWIVPALLFGWLIYGWDLLVSEPQDMKNSCYAPFFDYAYINLTMYLVYYWATLVAMIVLYRGIHRVAASLTQRAEAKEKQARTIISLQQCMAQMGVGMMVAQKARAEREAVENKNSASSNPTSRLNEQTVQIDSGFLSSVMNRSSNDVESVGVGSPSLSASKNPRVDIPLSAIPKSHAIVHERLSEQSSSLTNDLGSICSLNTYATIQSDNSYAERLSLQSIFQFKPTDFPKNTFERRNNSRTSSIQSNMTNGCIFNSFYNSIDRRITVEDSRQSTPSRKMVWFGMGVKDNSHVRKRGLSQSLKRSITSEMMANNSCDPLDKYKRKSHSFKGQFRSLFVAPRQHAPIAKINSDVLFEEEETPSEYFSIRRELDVGDDNRVSESPETQDLDGVSLMDNSISQEQKTNSDKAISPLTQKKRKRKRFRLKVDGSTSSQTYTDSADMSTDSETSLKEFEFIENFNKTLKIAGSTKNSVGSTIKREMNELRDKSRSIGAFMNPLAIVRRRRQTHAEKRAKKAFRTITIILGAFVLLWSPFYILASVYGFCRNCVPNIVFNASYYMCYINSSINPFCYALANRQFRKVFLQLLRGEWRQHGIGA